MGGKYEFLSFEDDTIYNSYPRLTSKIVTVSSTNGCLKRQSFAEQVVYIQSNHSNLYVKRIKRIRSVCSVLQFAICNIGIINAICSADGIIFELNH